ncbi:CBS domain-containing protein [Spongiactinospora rosea]|uniref:hypothetical protein n=1 Tax=Spongiactinospora rosea TaxID=2248750 RepID=UPI0018F50984|nr:hypothetical protein [Spongiactinospora rosea]
MRARDLTADLSTVSLDTPVIEAARLLADQDLPGLIVVDEHGLPRTILPGTQMLRLAVPAYCQDDPALARVVDEAHADVFLRSVAGQTVREVLPQRQTRAAGHRPGRHRAGAGGADGARTARRWRSSRTGGCWARSPCRR